MIDRREERDWREKAELRDREWRQRIESRDRVWHLEGQARADRIDQENREHRRNQFFFIAFTSIVTAVAILIAGFSGVLSS